MSKKIKKLTLKEKATFNYLYPLQEDPNFNIKIAEKKEFFDTRYDGTKYPMDYDLCDNPFTIAPHQHFVRNFLSFNTPYSSLLLYHGLGTGKTCSAIGVCEEMRDYMIQMGISKRIIIVASPNVQTEFRLQLFDERKLEKNGNIWTMDACVGNKFINEIDPMHIKNFSKIHLSKQINRLINQYYLFMGYTEFSNYISSKLVVKDTSLSPAKQRTILKNRLIKLFEHRLIVIDEVHNIRIATDKQSKSISKNLERLIKYVRNIRLLLLSATPMYNTSTEIVWLLNLMNKNDGKSEVKIKEVFDKEGYLKVDKNGHEIGKHLLIQKSRGYISFVRGENPYLFPYRIYPILFSKNTVKNYTYPTLALNKKQIKDPLKYIDVYLLDLDEIQENKYNEIIENMEESDLIKEHHDAFGYTVLAKPLEALNIVYPLDSEFTGISGLRGVMDYDEDSESRYNYHYKSDILSSYGRLFHPDNLSKYSAKIAAICNKITTSDGIILIYSQYIEGGIIPVALALEEMGYRQYKSSTNLLKDNPRTKSEKYIIVSGNKLYSKDISESINKATSIDNKDGSIIKIILITKAGSEGVDFKYIRQIHILEPWYNMNRIEQIIGRGVRTCSHKALPLEERNVQIFMYGIRLSNPMIEAADLYVYRLAEQKAIKIGAVSRILKQTSIDCILNKGMNNYTEKNMATSISITLSDRLIGSIQYAVGDKPYSAICDYQDICEYTCNPDKINLVPSYDTYDESFILLKSDKIINLIKELFKEYYVLNKTELLSILAGLSNYSTEEIYIALTYLIEGNDYIQDKYNRLGKLINIGDYYLFQPIELNNLHISNYERIRPINYKKQKINVKISEKKMIKKLDASPNILDILDVNYNIAMNEHKLSRGEKNIYKFYHKNIDYLITEFNFRRDILYSFIIAHQIEILPYSDKLKLLNHLYFNTLNPYTTLLKEYFDKECMMIDDITALFIIHDKSYKLIKLDIPNQSWIETTTSDKLKLKQHITDKLTILPFNNIVGYMYPFRSNAIVFKTKDFTKKSKGFRCDQAAKNGGLGVVNILNKVLGKPLFTPENTKQKYTLELCLLEELILRYYHHTKESEKTWFLSPEIAILKNIEKLN